MFLTRFVTNSLILMLLCVGDFACAESGTGVLERILADYAALHSAESDYQKRQSRGQLSAAEKADYQAYLERLRSQFHLDCLQLARTDFVVLPPDVPCPSQVPVMPAAAAIDQQTERTSGEETAVLDQELDTALGEFDEMLLREQERVKAATPPTDSAMSGGGGQSGGADSGAESADAGQAGTRPARWEGEAGDGETGDGTDTNGASGAVATSSGSGSGGDLPTGGQGSTGGKQQTGAQGQPPDIPDGSDDDVVARQLREAAEKETDPELRKKLWEEYRKYKQGTR